MAAIRVTAVALAMWLGLAAVGLAQTSPPPQPFLKEQFDALVDAVKKAVADELKAQGLASKAAPDKSSGSGPADIDDQPGLLAAIGQRLEKPLPA